MFTGTSSAELPMCANVLSIRVLLIILGDTCQGIHFPVSHARWQPDAHQHHVHGMVLLHHQRLFAGARALVCHHRAAQCLERNMKSLLLRVAQSSGAHYRHAGTSSQPLRGVRGDGVSQCSLHGRHGLILPRTRHQHSLGFDSFQLEKARRHATL